ncbi:hypothetical protein [Clostridium perfringens]|uniref:hypothetical protein n=1 Tax=Clostridium perfringens TaxID=1502 RepID=UPI0023407091|nr:hypothetical protein [Clostridium perfringens]MDC4245576.1 hypothetical protein [Clostridium perfringens]
MENLSLEDLVYDVMKQVDITEEKKIYDSVKKELIKKKLQPFVFNEVMNDTNGLNIEDLDINEQIAIAKGLYNFGLEVFKPSKFFTINELGAYETYVDLTNEDNNNMILTFNDVTEYNDQYYCCTCWNPQEQYRARKNRLVRYNFATQRQATIKKTAFGSVRKEITLNRNSVNEIKQTIKNGKYFPPDTLTLNILLLEDKISNIEYNKEKRQLKIAVNYDIDAVDYTVVDFVDGWHRDTAIYELYNEGYDVEKTFKGFPVNISIVKPEIAAEFVRRQMLANSESEEYIKATENNNYNKFINKINSSNNSILFDQIAKTRKEMIESNKMTYNDIFQKALRYIERITDIKIEGRNIMLFGVENYIRITNTIIEILKEKKVDKNTMDLFTNEGVWLGYFALWEYLQKNKIDNELEEFNFIKGFVENMIVFKEDIKKLRLNTLKFSISKTYNFFGDLIQ